MATRNRANPLALAVLACLFERPMHPYEISSTLRSRGKHDSIKLNYGSLYTVVESLAKRGLIAAQEVERAGRRPERTVYTLTDAGRVEVIDWLSELLSLPVKEFTQFEAALSLMAVLPPDDAVQLLRRRVDALEWQLAEGDAMRDHAAKVGLPRLFLIEAEFRHRMAGAELAFVRELADDIEHGTFEGVDLWRRYHTDPEFDVQAHLESTMRRS